MAYIRTKRVKGIEYRYLVEGRRVGGKVVQKVIKYLGPARWPQDLRIRYLTANIIIRIHDRILEQDGGTKGIINHGYLDFVTDSVMVRYESAATRRERLVRKAAHLLFGIIRNHPFLDGNKRTGYEIADTFLIMNGYEIIADTGEILALARSIGSGQMRSEVDVAEWLRKRLKKAIF